MPRIAPLVKPKAECNLLYIFNSLLISVINFQQLLLKFISTFLASGTFSQVMFSVRNDYVLLCLRKVKVDAAVRDSPVTVGLNEISSIVLLFNVPCSFLY